MKSPVLPVVDDTIILAPGAHAIIDASPIPMAVNDDQERVTYLNQAFIKTFGYTLKDIPTLGEWWPKAYPELAYRKKVSEDWKTEFERARKSKTEFVPMTVTVRCKNGSDKIIKVSAAPLTNSLTGNHLAVLLDITEQEEIEQKLQDAQYRLSSIVESEPDCVKQIDSDGILLTMNQAGLAMIEADSLEQIKGKSLYDLIVPESLASFKELNRKVFAGQPGTLEFEIIGLKGTHRILETKAVPLRDSHGKVISNLELTRDITEQKKVANALKESSDKYRDLFNNAQVGMFRSRADGSELIDANAKYLSLAGMTREECVGKPSVNFWVDIKQRDKLLEIVRDRGYENDYEWLMRTKSGEIRTCLTSLKLDKETGILEGSIIDISDRARLQEELKKKVDELERMNKLMLGRELKMVELKKENRILKIKNS